MLSANILCPQHCVLNQELGALPWLQHQGFALRTSNSTVRQAGLTQVLAAESGKITTQGDMAVEQLKFPFIFEFTKFRFICIYIQQLNKGTAVTAVWFLV